MKRVPAYLALALLIVSNISLAGQWGDYIGEVIAKWLVDGRKMELLNDFAYRDPRGHVWKAPAGSIVDGASIPQFAWGITGGPFEGKYRDASVIHDVACDQKKEKWEDVHEAFYTAMLARDVGAIKAKVMYAAVYHFGPRWEHKYRVAGISASEATSRIASLKSRAPQGTVVIASTENRRSVGGGGGPLASIPGEAETRREVVDLNVRVVPQVTKLTEKDFDALRKSIEEQDLPLDRIRDFKKL